jgi:hypothetical protein
VSGTGKKVSRRTWWMVRVTDLVMVSKTDDAGWYIRSKMTCPFFEFSRPLFVDSWFSRRKDMKKLMEVCNKTGKGGGGIYMRQVMN